MYLAYVCNDRRSLDLFANVVHVTSLPGCETKHNDVDIVIIRESTEGEYSCLEHEVWSIVVTWVGFLPGKWPFFLCIDILYGTDSVQGLCPRM